MLSIAIVEDEEAARNALEACIKKYGEERGEEFSVVHFETASALLRNYTSSYDIVFMDIILPGLNGIAASKKLRELDKDVTLIFVTNMVNFAVRGYEVGALDFIVKPVVYDSFLMKMDRAIAVVRGRSGPKVTIHVDGMIKIVSASDICYIEVMRNSIIYHTQEGAYKVRGSMKETESMLPSDVFVRCNVCYLVNLRYVREVSGDKVTVGRDVLHISRAKRKHFLEALTDYLGRGV